MHEGSLESTKDAKELHEAIAECNSSFLKVARFFKIRLYFCYLLDQDLKGQCR